MAHEKSKDRKTECKNGSQHSRCIPNAHLTFEYSLKAIFTQLFTAKSKYTKKETSKAFFFIYKTQECNASGVSVNTESPFYIFFVCFRQSCTVTALSSNMHLVVSSLCPNDLICEENHPGLVSNRNKVSGFVPHQVSEWSLYPCWECIVSRHLPPTLTQLVQHMFQSTKSSNRFCW